MRTLLCGKPFHSLPSIIRHYTPQLRLLHSYLGQSHPPEESTIYTIPINPQGQQEVVVAYYRHLAMFEVACSEGCSIDISVINHASTTMLDHRKLADIWGPVGPCRTAVPSSSQARSLRRVSRTGHLHRRRQRIGRAAGCRM